MRVYVCESIALALLIEVILRSMAKLSQSFSLSTSMAVASHQRRRSRLRWLGTATFFWKAFKSNLDEIYQNWVRNYCPECDFCGYITRFLKNIAKHESSFRSHDCSADSHITVRTARKIGPGSQMLILLNKP